MKDRAYRRYKTECIIKKRLKQWNAIASGPRVPGKGKKKSHLDCGNPKCGVCRPILKGKDKIKPRDRRNTEN